MKTTLKTLLVTSVLAVSLSACSHLGKKTADAPCMKDGKCMVADRIGKIGERVEGISKDLQKADKDPHNPAAKEHVKQVQKELGEVITDLKDVQKSLNKVGEDKAGKKHKAKADAHAAKEAAKPAAAAKPATTTNKK